MTTNFQRKKEDKKEEEEDLKWYKLSYNFYYNNDYTSKYLLEYFQNHSPSSSSSSSSSPSSNNNNNKENNSISFYSSSNEIISNEYLSLLKECGIYNINNEERWYQLENIRNQARLDAHNNSTKNRINEVIHTCYILSSSSSSLTNNNNNKNKNNNNISGNKRNHLQLSYNHIKKLLQKLMLSIKNDYSLWSILDKISYWMIRQLQFTTCAKIAFDCSTFTERQSEISHQLISFLCSIGDLILPHGINSESLTITTTPPSTLSTSPLGLGLDQQDISSSTTSLLSSTLSIQELASLNLSWIMKKEISNNFLEILLKLLEKKREHVFSDQRNLFIEQTNIERNNIDGINDREYTTTTDWFQLKFCFCCL